MLDMEVYNDIMFIYRPGSHYFLLQKDIQLQEQIKHTQNEPKKQRGIISKNLN